MSSTVTKPPHEKKIAAAKKEGAKKGQDLSGLQDMGGVSYFHVALDKSDGNWHLIEAAMDGANASVDPNGEDRKGGAGNIGKVFFSASSECMCIYMHVPEGVSEKVTLQEWFDNIVSNLPRAYEATDEHEAFQGHRVLLAPTDNDQDGKSGFAKIELRPKECKGEVFTLKKRDEVIGLGFAFLRSKGVVPEEEESSDYEVEGDYEW